MSPRGRQEQDMASKESKKRQKQTKDAGKRRHRAVAQEPPKR